MERYVVVHGVSSAFEQEEAWQVCHMLTTSTVKGAKWLRSYYVPDRDELICDWEAPDEAAIRESLTAANAESLSWVKSISLAIYMEPELFK